MAISHLNERSAALLSHINAIGKLTISHVNGISAGFGVSYDTDAQSFFTATGITDTTQKNALNQLVLDLKSYGLWSKMTAIYPFVGGDATKHSYNLKNPATFQITWTGTIVHDANGFTGDPASLARGDTGVIPSTHLTEDDTHLSIYSRSIGYVTSVRDMGIFTSTTQRMEIAITLSGTDFNGYCYNQSTSNLLVANAISHGLFVISRRSNTDFEGYRNGTSLVTNTSADSGSRPTNSIYVGARNVTGSPNGSGHSGRNFAFASIGSGLTDAEVNNFYTAVQAFQAALGRAVTVSDSDAQLFIDAAGITDTTQKNAINQLVISLKAASLWTKMRAIYPFVGGTAATHKWNLKDPRDLDGAFRILWTGGVTHNANGVTPNGTTGYGDTRFNGSIQGLNDNSHLSIYIRTDTAAGDKADICGYDGGNSYWGIKAKDTGNVTFNGLYRFVTDGFISVAGNTDSRGFYINSRRGALDGESYKNGVSTGTCGDSTQNIPNIFVHIGKRSDTLTSYSDRNYAFASIGTGLTDTEAADFYNIVQAFETDLGRQI